MAKNQTLDEFYKQFREEVLCATDTETSGWTTDDFLTAVMLEYMEEAGEVTDPIICPYRDRGLQMNAYAISEDCESVDLFVSIYSDTEMPRSVSQTDIEVAIKRGVQLYQRAINDLYASFEKDNDTGDDQSQNIWRFFHFLCGCHPSAGTKHFHQGFSSASVPDQPL